jgi:hypothetical protein
MTTLFSRRGLVAASLFLGCLAPASAAGGAASTTTLAVTSSGSAVTTMSYGAVVTLTATVTSGGGPVTPGQVKFCDASATYCEDSHLLGIAQLTSAGKATLKFIPGPGSNSYKAIFVGTTSVAGSSSNTAALTVTSAANAAGGKLPSSTAIQVTEATLGASATVTGSNVPPGTPAPTGTVSFLDESNGGALLATGTLVPSAAGYSYAGSLVAEFPGTAVDTVVTGDFNGDGYLDIAVSGSSVPGSSSLTILLNNGTGSFVQAGPAIPGASAQLVADFNGDGNLDIVSLGDGSTVTVLLGNGDGTFTAAASPAVAATPTSMVAADLNGDGIEDIAVLSSNGTTAGPLTVLYGNGDGSFAPGVQPSAFPHFGYPPVVLAADFNGDGKADLAISDSYVAAVAFGGGASLSFSSEVQLTTSGEYNGLYFGSFGLADSQGGYVVAGDFNGDGLADLYVAGMGAVSLAAGQTQSACIEALYAGAGQGTFNTGTITSFIDNCYSAPSTAVTGSFNGDGSLDIVASSGGAVQEEYPGNPAVSANYYALSISGPSSLAAGNFDGLGTGIVASVDSSSNPSSGYIVLILNNYSTSSSFSVSPIVPEYPTDTTHQIVASYGGDSVYAASQSATEPLVSQGIPTTMTFTANPASGAVLGQAVTLTATLSPYEAQGVTTNGETVYFYGNGISDLLGTATLTNGVATATVTPSLVLNNVSANYFADKNFASSGAGMDYTVSPAPTTLTLTASPANLQVGGTLTLTATLYPYTVAGLSTNGEAVTFSSGGTVLGTATLTNGVATLQTVPPQPAGLPLNYAANYPGDANFAASSNNVSYTLSPVPSTLALAVSPLGTTVGQSVTLTATLAPTTAAGVSSNGGTVTFFTGTTSLGTGTLSNGVATLTTTALPAGVDSLTAQYAGDGTLAPSTSAPVSDTVLAIPSITFAVANKTYGVAPFTVAATSNSTGAFTYSVVSGPATISGATVTVTGVGTVVLQASQAATSADIAGTQTASFTVAPAALAIVANNAARVFGAANPAFTGTISGAVDGDTFTETFATAATAASIVGSYPITPSVTGANLADYTVTATPGALTVTQAGSSTTLALSNGNETFTATVASLTSGTPTGTVSFYEGQTAVGTGTLSGGVATYTASSFPAGDVVVSAEYSGDVDFTESQSPPILLLGLALGSDSLTVGQSGSVTDPATVSVVPGYVGTVTFSCTGLPANSSCSFAPATASFTGANASAQVTATISTGVSAEGRLVGLGDSAGVWAAGLLAPGLLGLAVAGRRRRLRGLMTIVALCGLALGVTACGGGSGGGPLVTPKGQATVQVVASGPNGLSQTSTVTLNVQ